jgi:hypothetical protein
MVEFSRRPSWNCPRENGDDDKSSNDEAQQGVETETDKFDSNFDEKFEKPEEQPIILTPEQKPRTTRPRTRLPGPSLRPRPSPTPSSFGFPSSEVDPSLFNPSSTSDPLLNRYPVSASDLTSVDYPDPVSGNNPSSGQDISMWLSPPTQPEVKSGGFMPNLDQTSGEKFPKDLKHIFNIPKSVIWLVYFQH